MRMVYLHNRFVPESAARVSIYDLSVMQGAAAFEMTRSFGGVHFNLREHLERLAHSCRVLGIPMPMPRDALMETCHDVSEMNDHGEGEEHRLLIVVSPGCAPIYRTLEGTIAEPWVYVADFPLRLTVAGMGQYYEDGVLGSWSHVEQVPSEAIPCTAKHRSRLHFHLAQVQARPTTWPLMVTRPFGPQRYVAEAPGANILLVEGGTVYGITGDALKGISQQTTMELMDGQWAESVPVERLMQASEVWLSGTPFCLLPVTRIDGHRIGTGEVGPVYRQALERWNRLVGLDIAAQVQRWDLSA